MSSRRLNRPKRVVFDPGERSATVYIFNQGDSEATYTVETVDRIMMADGQIVPAADRPEIAVNSAGDLVQYTPRRITLQPRESQAIRVRARPAIYDGDLYVRADLLEQLLPVRIKADASAQVLALTATEALPFQQRAEREQRRASAVGAPQDEETRLATPYSLFTAPSFDVNIGGQLARDGVDQASRYDIRAAGDLLYAGLEAYAGSDDDGRISDVRVTLSRKEPYGRALGPLGGTRAGVGDIFTPSMAIGAASYAGRGLYYVRADGDHPDAR